MKGRVEERPGWGQQCGGKVRAELSARWGPAWNFYFISVLDLHKLRKNRSQCALFLINSNFKLPKLSVLCFSFSQWNLLSFVLENLLKGQKKNEKKTVCALVFLFQNIQPAVVPTWHFLLYFCRTAQNRQLCQHVPWVDIPAPRALQFCHYVLVVNISTPRFSILPPCIWGGHFCAIVLSILPFSTWGGHFNPQVFATGVWWQNWYMVGSWAYVWGFIIHYYKVSFIMPSEIFQPINK